MTCAGSVDGQHHLKHGGDTIVQFPTKETYGTWHVLSPFTTIPLANCATCALRLHSDPFQSIYRCPIYRANVSHFQFGELFVYMFIWTCICISGPIYNTDWGFFQFQPMVIAVILYHSNYYCFICFYCLITINHQCVHPECFARRKQFDVKKNPHRRRERDTYISPPHGE